MASTPVAVTYTKPCTPKKNIDIEIPNDRRDDVVVLYTRKITFNLLLGPQTKLLPTT